MTKISAVSSFKRTVLGHDSAHYLKKGTDYLDRADQQHQNKYFTKAEELFGKAQRAFSKILLSERKESINHALAQAWLNYGDRLRDRGALQEAQASYEAARPFDPQMAEQRLKDLASPPPTPVQSSVSDMVMALSIHSASSLVPALQKQCFKKNPELGLIDEDVSAEPREIRNTHHLARSLCRLEGSAHQELNDLARRILSLFGQEDYKDLELWREVIPLARIADLEKCRYLIGKAHTVITIKENLLNVSALQSMAVMIHDLPEPVLKSSVGDLVGLLQGLTSRLNSEHQSGNTPAFQQLLQTTSQVLDAMVKAGVTGISRTQVQEPLDQALQSLSQTPELRFQAYYARQALAHLPNDESRWQEAWRRSTSIVLGAATLASAVRTFDPNKLMETYSCFVEAFAGTGEILERVAKLVGEMKDFGASAQEAGASAYQGLTQNRQNRWYTALQFLDTCLEERQWVQFEQFARHGGFNRNEAFLLGICQRLEQIARTQPEEGLQEAAIQFLDDLVDTPHWGNYKRVQQAVYQAFKRFETAPTLSHSSQLQAKECLAHWPASAAQGPIDAVEGGYVAPVWDPAWQQVGMQLLTKARGDAQRLTELQNTVLQSQKTPLALLGEDIQKLEAQYTKSLKADEVKEALAMYIAPQGKLSTESTEHFDLEEKVNAFLASEKKVLLLLGEGGSGKSTFNRHLARRLWAEYQSAENPQDRPIPLFIPLASLDDPGKNLIGQYLKEQGLSEAQIEGLRESQHFIFILDGYDEIAHRSQAFYAGNKLDRWHAQVIISSRPEYLGNNYQTKFYPPGSPSALEVYRLVGFSDALIVNYIDKYVAYAKPQWKAQEYKQAFKTIPELKELVRTPFMLKMTLEVLPALKAEGLTDPSKLTRLRLYETFVENWLNRSQERLGRIQLKPKEQEAFEALDGEFTSHGWAFSQNLAVAMYKAQMVAVTYSEAKDGKSQDWRAQYLGDAEEKTRLLRFNAPLSRQKDQYRFIHKSIQDYLVARAVWETLESGAGLDASVGGVALNGMGNVQRLWEELRDSDQVDPKGLLNRFNLVEDAAIQRFLVERVEQDQGLVKPLIGWIKASAQRESVSQGAANAMTILVGAGIQFNGVDLQGIRISGADLSGGVFDSAQLQRADLSGVKLRQSWLREANLSGAQMTGVQFGEWAYLEAGSLVASCAYSPDEKFCAMGLDNGVIRVYDVSSRTTIRTLTGHTSTVRSVVYSPSGAQIASGSDDNTVRLWDAHSGAPGLTLTGHTDSILSVVYSPSGAQIASGSYDATVRLWDAHSGAPGLTLTGHTDSILSVVYSPSGAQIASGSDDNTVRLWDANSGAPGLTLRGHTDSVLSVVYSPSGAQIASGSWDNTVRLWDAKSGAPSLTLTGHTHRVYSVVYSPSGAQIASGSRDKTVRMWDANSGAPGLTLTGHTDYVYSVVYSPSGAQIASGSADGTVRLWGARSGAPGLTLTSHTHSVSSVVYSPSGVQIASGSYDKTVRLWDANSGAPGLTLRGHTDSVGSVVYSPSGAQIASGSWDNTVRLWDAHSGAPGLILMGHTRSVRSVVYSPSGAQIASGSDDNTVRLWDAHSGAPGLTLTGHTRSVRSVVYSPSGAQIASGSDDNTVRLWDANSGAPGLTLRGHTDSVLSVVYSPSGAQIASGSKDKAVRLWDTHNGAPGLTLKGHTKPVWSVVYSPSGAQIASGSYDKTVRLWDVVLGECLREIRDFTGEVYSVAWKATSEGSYLLTGSGDQFVRQWEIGEGDGVQVRLSWMSPHAELNVNETLIEEVVGLSEMNRALMKQRGANDGVVLSDLA
ncbi:MAG: WD40 repeat [Glomeribacter sp. 1016415]|nr:WD40 repeat [Glomeribacter sp. 1016415]